MDGGEAMLRLGRASPAVDDHGKEAGHSNKELLPHLVQENPEDFTAWTSLTLTVEKSDDVNLDEICEIYEAFLNEFPLCYGYWKKYADHVICLGTIDKAVDVYEKATEVLRYSVSHWVNYCSFAVAYFQHPNDIRRLFHRGFEYVRKDYLCNRLWDKYIEFEVVQKHLVGLVHAYMTILKFPIKRLDQYFGRFKQLISSWKDELQVQNMLHSAHLIESESQDEVHIQVDQVLTLIKELSVHLPALTGLDILQRLLVDGEDLYKQTKELDMVIQKFEARILRPYFHQKSLDSKQLESWHCYLNYVENQSDFDWIIKLYERCLIPCAMYPEFWIRYIEYMEAHGGREMASLALHRATEIFFKTVPAMHLFSARFKEKIRDISGARAEFHDYSWGSTYIEHVIRKANMEKRLGNTELAFSAYEEALETSRNYGNSMILGVLYIQYSRFKLKVTRNIEEARDVLMRGMLQLPSSKKLLEELINFETLNGDENQILVLQPIVQKALALDVDVCEGMSARDREFISCLFLEFVDSCGDIQHIKRAWDTHLEVFPHLLRPYTTSSSNAAVRLPSYPLWSELDSHECFPFKSDGRELYLKTVPLGTFGFKACSPQGKSFK